MKAEKKGRVDLLGGKKKGRLGKQEVKQHEVREGKGGDMKQESKKKKKRRKGRERQE